MREQIGTDGLESTAPSQKNKFGPDPHALPSVSALPGANAGKATAAWVEILARSADLREVWEAAKLHGLAIPGPQFRVYASRPGRRQWLSTPAAELWGLGRETIRKA